MIPHSNSHRDGIFVQLVSAEFPPQTIHLSVVLRSGQKFILASSQRKVSDVRMIDSSEFFRVCMGEEIGTFILLTHHSADLPLNKCRNIST